MYSLSLSTMWPSHSVSMNFSILAESMLQKGGEVRSAGVSGEGGNELLQAPEKITACQPDSLGPLSSDHLWTMELLEFPRLADWELGRRSYPDFKTTRRNIK